MSGQPLDELRALLFGERAAERPDAPEPALLEYLIPLLPEQLLPSAFANALYIWEPRLRDSVWRALVQRISQSDDPLSTLTASLPIHVRRLVLQKLAFDIPDDVLRATLSFDSEWDRKQMLLDLVHGLPAERLDDLIDHLLDSLETIVPNPYYRSEVLAAIARRAGARRAEILEEALYTVIATERSMQRESALEDMFLTLAESRLTGLAMHALAALDDEHQRAGLWAVLASQLSESELTRALTIVEGYANHENRVVATLNLIAHAPPALRHEALDALSAEAQSIRDRNERTSALGRLAPHLARAGRCGDALTAIRRMRRGYQHLGHVLAQVAPHLDLPEVDEALELAGQLPRSAPRFEAALGLLPRLVQLGQTARAMSLAEVWQGAQQAQLLIEMLPEAPQSEQPRLFEGAMEALDELADKTNRAHQVVELAGRLNELGYPELAMQAAHATRNEAPGSARLPAPAPHLAAHPARRGSRPGALPVSGNSRCAGANSHAGTGRRRPDRRRGPRSHRMGARIVTQPVWRVGARQRRSGVDRESASRYVSPDHG